MFKCPNCGSSMPTDDSNDADWVALGLAVCGRACHAEMYERPCNEAITLSMGGMDEYVRLDAP